MVANCNYKKTFTKYVILYFELFSSEFDFKVCKNANMQYFFRLYKHFLLTVQPNADEMAEKNEKRTS